MEAFFLDREAGRLLCVYRPAAGSSASQRGAILIPPFAEELNMSRHTFGRLARRLAGSGAGVLTIDLYATGDSEGNFENGRWQTWRGDVLAGIDWLNARGYDSVDLLGLRLGGLLAMDVAASHPDRVGRVILWNPVTSGRNYVNQFLRLRTLRDLSDDGENRETTKDLRTLFEGGEPINVNGYQFSPELAHDLDALKLVELGAGCGAGIEWFEVVGEGATDLALGSSRVLDAWRANGVRVAAHPVADKPFWALQGIEPQWGDHLIAATVEVLT